MNIEMVPGPGFVAEATLNAFPSASVSLARTPEAETVRTVLNAVEYVSLTATGARLGCAPVGGSQRNKGELDAQIEASADKGTAELRLKAPSKQLKKAG